MPTDWRYNPVSGEAQAAVGGCAGCQSAPPIVSATWSRPNGGEIPLASKLAS
jgi:hypothetical protein